jgi:NADH:ubiquinone oxidoreductase subunit 4 (subunit M)
VFWGPETVPANRSLTDINAWELAGAFPLVVLIVLLGVFPRPLLNLVDGSVKTLQRVSAPRAAAVIARPAGKDAFERLEVHELPAPREEIAR